MPDPDAIDHESAITYDQYLALRERLEATKSVGARLEAVKTREALGLPAHQIIKFTKTGEGSPLMPTRGHIGDAGWDLYVSRSTVIQPNEFVDVHCDICAELPSGYWARITGRSSTLRKYGLLVAEGIIDNGYRGELFTGIFNLGSEVRVIPVHSRLAQLILHPLVDSIWMEAASLTSTTRGVQGFGSTGRGA